MSMRPAFLGLALVAAVLATVISMELDIGEPVADKTGIVPVRHVPKMQPHVASEDPEDHTDAWVATALARPLFSRDRKPTPVAAKSGGPAFASLPRLSGVVIGPSGKTAIFAGGENSKPIAVDEGKTLGPYTVQAITPNAVTVTGPEGERSLTVTADATTRDALAAEIPRVQQAPQPPQQAPGMRPGVLPGTIPGLPNGIIRPNLLRPGMLPRMVAPGQAPRSNEGSDSP